MSIPRSFALLTLVAGLVPGPAFAGPGPEDVFQARILPIFQSPNPSSCVQCHLAGIDLKNYILPSGEKTFLSLRDQGLVNLDSPEESKILQLIDRHEADRSGANMIHEERRKAEYDAFSAWLAACCADPGLRSAPALEPEERAGSGRPAEVIRFTRKDRLLDSFVQNVWSMRFRCVSCHQAGTPHVEKLVEKWGDQVVWVKSSPAETLDYLINETDLIDVENPGQSLLLLKPLNAVKHGGGPKFQKRHESYKSMRGWLEDYAAVATDSIKTADQLPRKRTPLRFASQNFLKIEPTPVAWAGKFMWIEVYAWDPTRNDWEAEPVAKGDNIVLPRRPLWQSELVLLAGRGSQRAENWAGGTPRLPKGRYQVRLYLDREDRSAADWRAGPLEEDYAGKAEFHSEWPTGFANRPTLPFRLIQE